MPGCWKAFAPRRCATRRDFLNPSVFHYRPLGTAGALTGRQNCPRAPHAPKGLAAGPCLFPFAGVPALKGTPPPYTPNPPQKMPLCRLQAEPF